MFDRRGWLEHLIFEGETSRRFTQDSPVLPDVWIQFGMRALDDLPDERARVAPDAGDDRVDVLLTPHRRASASDLFKAVHLRLDRHRETPAWLRAHAHASRRSYVAYNQASVVARLFLDELIRDVLPLSQWWRDTTCPRGTDLLALLGRDDGRAAVSEQLRALSRAGGGTAPSASPNRGPVLPGAFLWLVRIVGSIALARELIARDAGGDETARRGLEDRLADLPLRCDEVVACFSRMIEGIDAGRSPGLAGDRRGSGPAKASAQSLLWTVSLNRVVRTAIARSAQAVKADAARRLFETKCSDLGWAVVDGGIDARHPAFRRRSSDGTPSRRHLDSRVVETYDFTRIRRLLDPDADLEVTGLPNPEALERAVRDIKRRLLGGHPIDWPLLRDVLLVRHDSERGYVPPRLDHGTHVAGILAGDWRHTDFVPRGSRRRGEPDPQALPAEEEGELVGVCPDLTLYDLRVLTDDGTGTEFEVMAALQFIRYLNSQHDQPCIHGANLSLSMQHDVANYACGRTPVCDECERLVNSGVVVVAAAGNDGYSKYLTPEGNAEGYRSISISDPGNADAVITVGATHRYQPHMYGVSYFSSRGPTGDGRQKPDLVAPGEKITAPLPNNGVGTKDGTSMAAPHVSGAAALLIARHSELKGRPQRIKEILCATATDLRRERYFQGAGMVDILRALQSV